MKYRIIKPACHSCIENIANIHKQLEIGELFSSSLRMNPVVQLSMLVFADYDNETVKDGV